MQSRAYYKSIEMEIGIVQQIFLKVLSGEFQENLSRGKGADIRSQTDRRDLHERRPFL
jgi:hypothetical protein